MRRLAIILLLACCTSVGYAQYFSKHYSLYAGTNGYISSIQVVNDTIYAMCYVGDSLNPAYGIAAFERFDKYGNRISYNPLTLPPLINILANNNTLIQTNDGGFAYGASTGIDSITYAIAILKYDHYGNFQWYKEIIDSNSLAYQIGVLVQDSFSNYYFTGVIQGISSTDVDMYLTKTDSLGNLSYTKTFLHPNFDDVGLGICFNNKGHVIIGGDALSSNITDFNTAKDYMEIYELDTAGNQINYILGADTNGPPAYNISSSKDGGYLIASGYYCYRDQNTLKVQGCVAKLDSNFHEIWKIDTGPCSSNTNFNAQSKCADGYWIAIGQSYDDTNVIIHINGWIMKYSENGQVLWSKQYRGVTSNGVNGDNNPLYSVAFMSDGSILCAGQATNNDDTIPPSQQGWLLHLDTAGCLPDSNSCGIADGVADIPAYAYFLVYPNPASSVFTVALAGPNDINGSDLHFRLYDLTGRMVADHILREQTTVLHRSGLASGMYLWQIADGDKGLKNGKMVFDPQTP